MDITMPQLGETVTEGTITRWLKQVGDTVALDEPLFEVSTDKVDSEVPAAAAGVLTEILVPEGDTVEVGARLAVLGDAADGGRHRPRPRRPRPRESPAPAPAPPAPRSPARRRRGPAASAAPASTSTATGTRARPGRAPAPAPVAAATSGGNGRVTSPVVRRLIAERGLDPASITGTGEGGRITRRDVTNAAPARAGHAGARCPRPGGSRRPRLRLRRRCRGRSATATR